MKISLGLVTKPILRASQIILVFTLLAVDCLLVFYGFVGDVASAVCTVEINFADSFVGRHLVTAYAARVDLVAARVEHPELCPIVAGIFEAGTPDLQLGRLLYYVGRESRAEWRTLFGGGLCCFLVVMRLDDMRHTIPSSRNLAAAPT